jgi:hypothetical protein
MMSKVIVLLSLSLLVFAFGGGAQPQQTPNAPDQQRTATHDHTTPGKGEMAQRAAAAHEKMEKYVDVKITPGTIMWGLSSRCPKLP